MDIEGECSPQAKDAFNIWCLGGDCLIESLEFICNLQSTDLKSVVQVNT